MSKLVDQTMVEFAESVAGKTPTPGGGSVSALAGSLAGALGVMVGNLTIGRKKYQKLSEKEQQELDESYEQLQRVRTQLMELVDKDKEAFDEVMVAVKMPKETEGEQADRQAALQKATKGALEVPLETARACLEVLKLLEAFARKGNPNAITDLGVGALMAFAALEGALYNVEINLNDIEEDGYRQEVVTAVKQVWDAGKEQKDQITQLVKEKM